jgi:succinoglycan biosynthesis transport protein ExoP
MTPHDDLLGRALRLLTYHRRRIWWITSRVFVLTVVMTALGLALIPKYVARTKLTLLPTRSELGFAAVRPELWGLSPASLLGQTHEEALLSRTLAEDVARTLLAENAADLNNGGMMGHVRRVLVAPVMGSFHRAVTLLNTGRWETPDPFMSLVDAIRGRTRVRSLPGSFVFEVSVTWENPRIAAKIANLMTERYVQMTLRTGQAEMRTTREYIDARIKETGAELEALEKRIREYRSSEKLYSTSTDLDLGLQEMSQYVRDLNATRVSWEQLDARINALKSYQTPAMLAAIEAERAGLTSRQAAIEKVIGEHIAKLDRMPAKEAGLLDLYRERMSKERALTALQDRLLETKVAEAAQLSAVRIIDTAIPPVYPERPLLLRNAAASVLVGLLLSLGVVLLAEARRAGLRSREDLGPQGGDLLGLVPYVAAAGHGDPDAEKGGKMAEFFRSIAHGRHGTVAHRRKVKRHLEHLFLRLADDESTRASLFVSLNGGEGKTFLIEHLARLAREAGRKVLLVDANLSHPTLHLSFGKFLKAGLTDVLVGRATARDVVVPVDESLDLICAGEVQVNGQAHWDLSGCKAQLSSLARDYDFVLMDSAALRQDSAVSRLLMLADRTVCVFDATSSARDDLDTVREHLRGSANPVHFILNNVLHEADHLFTAGLSQEPRPDTSAQAASPPPPG